MKFHNQRSFMGHEISNVNNKPLLHKKGKQWIVVAVSALILVGFGSMVSTTTHADTTAQPTTTKVAPKPANTSANVMKQAQGMHKALANNAAVQKPSAPSSAAAKTTAPASATSTSAKSSSVSASSSASSQALSSVNSAIAKSSSVSSNSNSSNNKATKPAVHMMLMSTPEPSVQTGKWGTAEWTLDSSGTLNIHDGNMNGSNPTAYLGDNATSPSNLNKTKVYHITTSNVQAPVNSGQLFDGYDGFSNVQTIDLSGLNTSNTTNMSDMFHGCGHLQQLNLKGLDTHKVTSMSAMFDDDCNIQALDMSSFNTSNVRHYDGMFWNMPSLESLDLSNFDINRDLNPSVGSMFSMNTGSVNGEPGGDPANYSDAYMRPCQNLHELVLNPSFKNINTADARLNDLGIGTIGNAKDPNGVSTNHWSDVASKGLSTPFISNYNHPHSNRPYALGVYLKYVNALNNEQVTSNSATNEYYGLNSSSVKFLPINGITLPKNYILAPNVGTTININSGNSQSNPATVNLLPLSYQDTNLSKDANDNYIDGTWGTASWGLYGNHLYVTDGTVTNNLNNNTLNNYINNISTISTLNVKAPDDASNTFSFFKNATNLDLSGFNDSNSSNTENILGNTINNNSGNGITLTLGPNTILTGIPIEVGSNGSNTANVNLADGSSHYGTYNNIVQDTVNYVYNYDNHSGSDNNRGSFQPMGTKGLFINGNLHSTSNRSAIGGTVWTDYSDNLIPGQWNTIPVVNGHSDSSLNFSFSGSTHHVNILPNIVNQTVNYLNEQDSNNQVGSSTFSGYTNGALLDNESSAPDTTFTTGSNPSGLPKGYNIKYPNKAIGYGNNNGTFNMPVDPSEVSDKIVFNNDTSSNTSAPGMMNSHGSVSAPSGYHFINNYNGSFTFNDSSNSFDVAPNSINVQFMNNGSNVSSKNITTTGCSNNNYTIQSGDIPTYYSLASNQSSVINFVPNAANNHVYNVNVSPESVSETIDYKYNNNNEGTSSVSGPYNSSSEITSTSAKGINSGWHLASNGSFTFNNGSVNVNVSPNTISDTIKYQVSSSANVKFAKAGQVLSSETSKFNDSRANVAGNTSATIMSANNKYVPTGYHMASNSDVVGNKTTNSASSSTSDVVTIVPNSESEKINYIYNNSINKPVSSSTINGGYYDNSSSVASNTVPNGWQFAANPNNSFTFGYKSNTDNVNIAPNVDTDTVDYQSDGKTLASQQFTGNDEHATQAGDNSFDVTAKNDSKIPSGYELVNSDNTFSFDNGIHDVAIQPIPQSVPYIMPTSSAAAPVTTVATPTSEAPTVSKPASHYRYAKVITPLQLHTSKHFTKKNGVLVIKHPMAFKIMKIVHDHKLTRYEVKYQGHNYFITGNDHFTINNYVQKHDFKSRKHMMVKVITPMIEYKHAHFNRKYAIKVFKKGAILPVKRVFTIGKGEMTRFELTNGRFVTSNKLFVKVIK